jgi:REP element-mobilizing transposase RayT
MHIVFSTKGRANLIFADMQERLWAFVGGIARQNEMTANVIGGTDNHLHLLLSLSSTVPIAKAVQLIKGGSSKWVHDTFPQCDSFAWQEGYGAFSVSTSMIDSVTDYIGGQMRHHRVRTFEEEFVELLERHGVEYDSRYVFD